MPYDALEMNRIHKDEPVKVSAINISGYSRTKQGTLLKSFDRLSEASTVGELQEAIYDGLSRSDSLAIFDKIDVNLDSSDDGVEVNIIVNEKEKSTVFSLGAEYQNTERQAEANASYSVKNVLGQGDSVTIKAEGLNTHFSDISLKRWKELPYLAANYLNDTSVTASLEVPRLIGRNSYEALSFVRGRHGVSEFLSSRFQTFGLSTNLNHNHSLSYKLESRRLADTKRPSVTLSDDAGAELTEQVKTSNLWPFAGPQQDLKSSISHTYRLSTLDNMNLPNEGVKLTTNVTLAGLGGDVHHLSGKVDFSAYKPLLKKFLIAAVDLSMGHIIPTSSQESSSISITDRLFERVRGYRCVGDFEKNSLEQKGGNFAMSACAKLILKNKVVDDLLASCLRAHLFINAGNVVNLDGDASKRYNEDVVRQFIQDAQASFGVGFLLGLGGFKVELNYAVPYYLTKDSFPGDHQKHFSKFGIHVSF